MSIQSKAWLVIGLASASWLAVIGFSYLIAKVVS